MDVQGAAPRPLGPATSPRDSRFEAEAKYAALVEQIPGVVYLDPVNESLDSIFVSPQVRDLLGIEPEAWIADQYCWSNHVHPDDFIRVWDEYMSAYTNDVPMSHEYRMVHEDGTVKWVLELARPIHDEHGDPWVIQGVIFDITARKEAEELLAARNERLGSIIETQRDIAATELDVDAVMRTICERTQELTHAEAATILILDGQELVMRVGHRVPRRQGRLSRAARGHTARLDAPAQPVGDPRRRADGPPSGRPGQRDGDALGSRRAAPPGRGDDRSADRRVEDTGCVHARRRRHAEATLNRPLLGDQPCDRVRVEPAAGRGARSLRDDLRRRGHRHHVGVPGRESSSTRTPPSYGCSATRSRSFDPRSCRTAGVRPSSR